MTRICSILMASAAIEVINRGSRSTSYDVIFGIA
jgi:hypothetical protein